MKTVKLWIHWKGSESLIKLKDGEEIHLSHFYRHDEGYSHTITTYRRQQGRIICEVSTVGRDCDGNYGDRCITHALIGTCPHPQWRRIAEIYTDHSAIAAGY